MSESGALGRPAHPRSADPFRNRAVGRNELDPFARPDHLPAAFVYLPMVEVTKREKVGEVALSAAGPELDMMGTGPVDRPVTPGRRAVAMPSLEGSPLRRRDRPCRPAHIDHHRVRLEDPAHGSVANQPSRPRGDPTPSPKESPDPAPPGSPTQANRRPRVRCSARRAGASR